MRVDTAGPSRSLIKNRCQPTAIGAHAQLTVSPWALGFSALNGARLAAVVTGIAIAALALWTLFTDKDYSAWWRDRLAH